MHYTLYKVERNERGTLFTAKGDAPSIAGALALAPRFGWGKYQINNADGQVVAVVRIAAPSIAPDVPVELPVPVEVPLDTPHRQAS